MRTRWVCFVSVGRPASAGKSPLKRGVRSLPPTHLKHTRTRYILALILVLFAGLGVIYSVIVPPFEASDEKWHYPMVKYVADHWSLPVQEPGVETPWRQEGSQAPLYYALAAVATSWIDTADMETVRHLNPHVDPGATPDGNINLVVHNPAQEAFPWRGTVLAVHLIRLLSVGMGVATVYLTYRLAHELFPGRPALALGAAAINAFTPMFVFISGAVNNDNLVMLLCSLALLLMVKMTQPRVQYPKPKSLVIGHLSLGFVLGLAALTKEGALGLFPLAVLAVTVCTWRHYHGTSLSRRLGLVIGHLSLVILTALAVAGWWYWRNWRLYGDFLGWNAFIEILGQRDVPADLAQLWRERYSFLAGYWGNFGGLNVPMPAWTYAVLNGVLVVAGLGLVMALFRAFSRAPQVRAFRFRVPGFWSFVICHLPLLIVLLWPAAVVYGWIRWARITWSSQGRLVFSAISAWSLLLALGLAGWLPRRWGRWAVAALALFLLGLAMVAPFAWIAPAYVLPNPLADAQVAAIPHQVGADFGGVMRLLGYDLETEAVQPGGQVGVTLYWEALAPADWDYTVFVHLLGEGELLVAQRDTFPGLGLLSTTWLEPGFRWTDRYVLQVTGTAYAPDGAQVEVGMYDAGNNVRLSAMGPDGEPLGDNLRFGQVQVRARSGDYPNPISVNFGDRMELVGYDLDRGAFPPVGGIEGGRVVRPGEAVSLTLYWRGRRRMDVNYTVSAQLVDTGQRKAAQHDGWPLGGAAPTAAWEPGQVLADTYALAVCQDSRPGVYDVRVAVYVLEGGEIMHLPVIPEGGQMLSDHVVLTRVRVVP